eukprot:4267265-Lingulodinium_polyedra.AAC.1
MPPIGLGRRATTTEFKIRAWLHAMSLGHGLDEDMAGALRSFCVVVIWSAGAFVRGVQPDRQPRPGGE